MCVCNEQGALIHLSQFRLLYRNVQQDSNVTVSNRRNLLLIHMISDMRFVNLWRSCSYFQCWPGADGKYYDDWCDEEIDGSAKCHNYEDQCNKQKPICADGYDTSNFACVSFHKL